jgi:hypothetical protein
VSIFISYSHADENYRAELEKHLTMLKKQGLVSIWHDRRIEAGDNFELKIEENLLSADLILLLVSSGFLASGYCYEIEMKKALARNEKGEARVIPVILRACDWKNSPFGMLLAAPKDGKPVNKHPDIDEAYLEIVEVIRSALPATKSVTRTDAPSEHTVKTTGPRSSNIYIKKKVTDEEKDKHRVDAFEYMATFFENSLGELNRRNPSITNFFRRIDANQFTATIYSNGEQANKCRIWFTERGGFENGILFSEGNYSDRDNSYNDSLTVEDDGALLYLCSHMPAWNIERGEKLTFEGAAEYYWARFIQCLQE